MIEELKTFIAVVEFQNFTKAAEAINLSQPSVSTHIKHLEDYFDTVLIQRSVKQKHIHITEAGILVYERSKQIVNLLLDTRDELFNYDTILKGTLRIGASFTFGEYILPNFLSKFTSKYPDLHVEIIIGNTHDICVKAKNFEVDLALVEGTVTSSSFLINQLYKDYLVIAAPYDHPLSQNSVSIKDLDNQIWISREPGSGTKEYLEHFLSSNNITAKHIIQFGSNYSIKEAVKNNLGISLISTLVTDSAVKNNEISILKSKEKYTRNFYYILLKGIIPSKASLVFIEMIKNYMNDLLNTTI